MKKFFANLFGKEADQEFIALMQVALEDPDIREQLLRILSLTDDTRRATVRQWRAELEKQNAPDAIIKTLIYLEHDGPAKRALEILNRP